MKPEQKANELVERFKDEIPTIIEFENDGSSRENEDARDKAAARCAIKAVELLIAESNRTEQPITFWQSVLTILKQLS